MGKSQNLGIVSLSIKGKVFDGFMEEAVLSMVGKGKKVQRLMWETAYGFPWLQCKI